MLCITITFQRRSHMIETNLPIIRWILDNQSNNSFLQMIYKNSIYIYFVAWPTERPAAKNCIDLMLRVERNLHQKNQTFCLKSNREIHDSNCS